MALIKRAKPKTGRSELASLILQRRYQVLVHSFLYYTIGVSIVTDELFDKWAKELYDLQQENTELANTIKFHETFKDFDGNTGYNLSYEQEEIIGIAYKRIAYTNDLSLMQVFRSKVDVVFKET